MEHINYSKSHTHRIFLIVAFFFFGV
jgi:hypothetical protein